jgi:hypothetical protein
VNPTAAMNREGANGNPKPRLLGAQLDPSLFIGAQASINEPSTEKCPRLGISPWQRPAAPLRGKQYLPIVNGVARGIATLTTLRGAPSICLT